MEDIITINNIKYQKLPCQNPITVEGMVLKKDLIDKKESEKIWIKLNKEAIYSLRIEVGDKIQITKLKKENK